MIYLKESFNIHPASPATRDRFVEAAEKVALPAAERLGARPVGAWFCHEEWFSQIVHVSEFDDLAAFGAWRDAARADEQACAGQAELAALAPERNAELLELLGPVPASSLQTAIEQSRSEPAGTYAFAILDVAPGMMDRFKSMLAAGKDLLPIVASWRELTGNPDRVIDVWKGDVGGSGYAPTDERQNAFFEPIREVAPRERIQRLHPLPYSPLR